MVDPLKTTHQLAHFDEMPYGLPTLFRVDEDLGLHGGRLYRTECTRECDVAESDTERHPERICLHGIPFAGMPSSLAAT